ncbi:MAG: RibD family protein, partial [Bacteroidota bacterium]
MQNYLPDQLLVRRSLDLAKQQIAYGLRPLGAAVLASDRDILGEGQSTGSAAILNAARQAIDTLPAFDPSLAASIRLFLSITPNETNISNLIQLVREAQISHLFFSTIIDNRSADEVSRAFRAVQCKVSFAPSTNGPTRLYRIDQVHTLQKRPYILLKYAQSADGFIGQDQQQVWLTNPYCRRLAHKWRSEYAAIMVGTNTALIDNPSLNNRYYHGSSPLRIVLDLNNRLPKTLTLKTDEGPTWIIQSKAQDHSDPLKKYWAFSKEQALLPQLLDRLYQSGYPSLMVEGGARLLQSFVDAGLWDEARILISPKVLVQGIPAPQLPPTALKQSFYLDGDRI